MHQTEVFLTEESCVVTSHARGVWKPTLFCEDWGHRQAPRAPREASFREGVGRDSDSFEGLQKGNWSVHASGSVSFMADMPNRPMIQFDERAVQK